MRFVIDRLLEANLSPATVEKDGGGKLSASSEFAIFYGSDNGNASKACIRLLSKDLLTGNGLGLATRIYNARISLNT